MTASAADGVTVWLTGLPSSGKSTIARTLAVELGRSGRRCQVLDGDEVRPHLSGELGFSKQDRDTNVRRIGFVAEMLAFHGVIVVVPVIAPYQASRAAVRRRHEEHGLSYLEVHVDAPVDVCAQRDVKALYSKQSAGLLTGLTGVDDPYERPIAPELRVRTDVLSVAASVALVRSALDAKADGRWPSAPNTELAHPRSMPPARS